jgi:hypothetical protein
VADNFRRDTLTRFVFLKRKGERLQVRVGVKINKARADELTFRLQGMLRGGTFQWTDSGNAFALHRDICPHPGIARAVNNASTRDEQIVHK